MRPGLAPGPLQPDPVSGVLYWPPSHDEIQHRWSVVLKLQSKRKPLPQRQEGQAVPLLDAPVLVSRAGDGIVVNSSFP